MTYRTDRKRTHPRLQDRPIKVERIGDRYFGSMPTPEIRGLKVLWSNEASAEGARNAIVAAYATMVGSGNLEQLNRRRARARVKYAKQKEISNGIVSEADTGGHRPQGQAGVHGPAERREDVAQGAA